jgi:hypothetical protein
VRLPWGSCGLGEYLRRGISVRCGFGRARRSVVIWKQGARAARIHQQRGDLNVTREAAQGVR